MMTITAETAPEITIVQFYDSGGNATYTFQIGDQADLLVYANDPDQDMETLSIQQTHVASGNSDSAMFELPEQTEVEMVYHVGPMDIIGPAGEWKLEFTITDAEGNTSSTKSYNLTATD